MPEITGSFSHYKLLRELGRGGMSTVYYATDTVDGKPVALKMLFPHFSSDRVIRTRFLREGKAGTELNHPGIVSVYEVGEEKGQPFIAMELVEGRTLEESMEEDTLDLQTVIGIGTKVADALAAAHAYGVIHRDIKPRNIMLCNADVKVMDFGLVRMLDAPAITQKYEVVGTLHYMSPQQAIGAEIDGRTDVFSLGVVLYEMLTGSLPFEGNHPGAIIHSILHLDPLRMDELRKGVPPELEQVVFKALQKKPQDRYQSATELKIDLENVKKSLEGETIAFIATQEVFEEQPRSVQSALVGRQKELDLLDGHLREMLKGKGSIILVSGEAGIGKSRLVWELGRKMKEHGYRYIAGRCFFGEEGFPYQPVLEIIRGYFGLRGVKDTKSLHDFIRTKTWYLSERESVIRTLLLTGGAVASLINREQVWDTIAELIRMMSQDRPLLLHMDDLHWGDTPTLNLFSYLAMRIRGERVLMVGTYRPEELTQGPEHHPLTSLMAKLRKESLCSEIHLDRLDLGSTGDVIASVFPHSDFPEHFVRMIYEETDGNPLFIVEVLTLLRNEGAITKKDGGWAVSHDVGGMKVPGRVTEVIMNRFSSLSQEERILIEVASVEGRSFHSDTLCSCLGLPRVRVLVALQDLEQAHHLVYASEREYHFDHVKIRDVIYDNLTPELKQQCHRCIGEYLRRDFGGDDEYAGKIAHHLIEANEGKDAIPYLIRAGDHASQLFANEDAIRRLDMASRLLDLELSRDRALDTLRTKLHCTKSMAEVKRLIGSYGDAHHWYEEVIKLACELNDEKERAYGVYGLGVTSASQGDYGRALPHFGQALAIYKEMEDLVGLGDTLRNIGIVRYCSGEYDEALKYYSESLEAQRQAGNKRGQGGALNNMGNVHYDRGDYEKALRYFDQSLAIEREIGFKLGEGNTLNNIGNVHSDRGDYEKALDHYQRSLAIQRKIGNKLGEGDALNNIAEVHYNRGDYGAALELQRESLTTYKQIGRREGEWESTHRMSRLWLELGDKERAMRCLDEGRRIAELIGTKQKDLWSKIDGALAKYSDGLFADALAAAERGAMMAMEMSEAYAIVEGFTLAARAAAALGNIPQATRHAQKALSLAMERERKADVARTRLLLGKIDFSAGNVDKAESNLAKALTVAEDRGIKESLWQAHYYRGRILLEKSDRTGAAREFERAKEVVDRILSGLSEDMKKTYFRKKEIAQLQDDLKVVEANHRQRRE